MMKTWTVDEILAKEPCGWDSDGYTRERLEGLFDGRDSMSTLDVCDLDIPPEDIIWVACRGLGDQERETWLDLIVTRAVTSHALHCGIPVVETWARNWLSGEDRTAGVAAEAAVWAADAATVANAEAAYTGAAASAWAARAAAEAVAAARAAVDAAAGAATRAAVRAAIDAAAGAAARAAARRAAVDAAAGAAWAAAEAAEWAGNAVECDLQVEDLRTMCYSLS